MNITIVGSGYVGLVTGACFAKMGNKVTCLDTNEEIVKNLNKGILHIFEPELEEIVKEDIKNNNIVFTSSKKIAYKEPEIIFICVPTPQTSSGEVDLSFVKKAASDIAKNIKNKVIIVNKSTVPIGTTKLVEDIIKEELKKDIEFDVISNPEFLAEGSAVKDFLYPSRICIGVEKEETKKIMQKLYHPLTRGNAQIIIISKKSAELAKYACNAMLATRISFMNELANFSEKVGANIEDIRRVMQTDPRIGNKFLYAGVGYGGACFPKDVRGIIKTAEKNDSKLNILKCVDEVNEKQKTIILKKIENYTKIDCAKICVWGLAFKKNTNDVRESPSIKFIKDAIKKGAKITCFDPEAINEAKKILKEQVIYKKTKEDAIKNNEILVVFTDWDEFKQPDFKELKKQGIKAIFDGRNLYEPSEVKKEGIKYFGIGR